MRSVVLQYQTLDDLAAALRQAVGQSLPLKSTGPVRDGEWALAMFELGDSLRATAAAGRVLVGERGPSLVFERRDWERLVQFSARPSVESPLRQTLRTSERPQSNSATSAYESADALGVAMTKSPDPLDDEPPTIEDPTEKHQPLTAPTHARILMVDDDEELLEIVGVMLEAVGLSVLPVTTSEAALVELQSGGADLVVLDWTLPGMSGLELCRSLRRDPRWNVLPIVFLTAHAGTAEMVEAFAAGADDYVTKPFRAAELGARIFGLLRRSGMTKSAST